MTDMQTEDQSVTNYGPNRAGVNTTTSDRRRSRHRGERAPEHHQCVVGAIPRS